MMADLNSVLHLITLNNFVDHTFKFWPHPHAQFIDHTHTFRNSLRMRMRKSQPSPAQFIGHAHTSRALVQKFISPATKPTGPIRSPKTPRHGLHRRLCEAGEDWRRHIRCCVQGKPLFDPTCEHEFKFYPLFLGAQQADWQTGCTEEDSSGVWRRRCS